MRILAAGWCCLCVAARLLGETPSNPLPKNDVAQEGRLLGGYMSGLTPNAEITVFQGLPHRMSREWFAREEARGVHFEVNQSSFYRAPIAIRAKTSAVLDHILTAHATFDLPPPGVFVTKMCVFHADWAVRWTLPAGESATTRHAWALICFGCDDVQIAVADNTFETVALTKEGHAALWEQLSPLQGPLQASQAHRRPGRPAAMR